MYFVINKNEYFDLIETGRVSERVNAYWLKLIEKLPLNLQNEAGNLGFTLEPHPILGNDNTKYSRNLCFACPNASLELSQELEKLENVIICMEEPV